MQGPSMFERAKKGGEEALHGIKVSAAQIQMYLKGVNYPAGKQKLMDAAKSNGAPEPVMQFINRLPDRQYNQPTDIEQEFNKIK